jgi:ubiquitin thioesterase OTU1
MPGFTISVRASSGRTTLELPAEATLGDLRKSIEASVSMDPRFQDIRAGFPPKPIEVADATKLADLFAAREQIVLEKLKEPRPLETAQAPSAEPPAKKAAADEVQRPDPPVKLCDPNAMFICPGDLVERLQRKVIPADNSCLFAAIRHCLQLDVDVQTLRQAVVTGIRADMVTYNEAILGKDVGEYCSWIQKSDSWGGAIELTILAEALGVQLAVIHIRNNHCEFFPHEASAPGARIFLLHDGIHYDAIESGEVGAVFSADDDSTLAKALGVAKSLSDQKQFTDTANFTLQCQHCFTLLKGENEAREHGKATGHFNFQEAPKK